MPQIFETSAGGDIGGAKRGGLEYHGSPLVSGMKLDSTTPGLWPQPALGGFAPQQPTASPTVMATAGGAGASYTYIPTCTGSLSSVAGTPLLSTQLQVAALVYDTNNNKLWAWNPVSSAWAASTLNFTTTST